MQCNVLRGHNIEQSKIPALDECQANTSIRWTCMCASLAWKQTKRVERQTDFNIFFSSSKRRNLTLMKNETQKRETLTMKMMCFRIDKHSHDARDKLNESWRRWHRVIPFKCKTLLRLCTDAFTRRISYRYRFVFCLVGKVFFVIRTIQRISFVFQFISYVDFVFRCFSSSFSSARRRFSFFDPKAHDNSQLVEIHSNKREKNRKEKIQSKSSLFVSHHSHVCARAHQFTLIHQIHSFAFCDNNIYFILTRIYAQANVQTHLKSIRYDNEKWTTDKNSEWTFFILFHLSWNLVSLRFITFFVFRWIELEMCQ